MKPTYEMPGVRLYFGDSAEVIPSLSDKFDLLVTDPPYGVAYQSSWREKDDQFDVIHGDRGEVDVAALLSAAVAKLHQKRHVYVFGPKEPVLACERLTGHVELVWDKGRMTMGDLASPWGHAHEAINFAVFVPSKAERAQGRGNLASRLRRGSVLHVPRIDGNLLRHPNEKPVALVRQLVESSSVVGDTVFDPFMGSGSTVISALLAGRAAVGIERDPHYFDETCRRVDALLPSLRLLESA